MGVCEELPKHKHVSHGYSNPVWVGTKKLEIQTDELVHVAEENYFLRRRGCICVRECITI